MNIKCLKLNKMYQFAKTAPHDLTHITPLLLGYPISSTIPMALLGYHNYSLSTVRQN